MAGKDVRLQARVLVVDDSSMFRKNLRMFLVRIPWVVVAGEARSGEEAVARVCKDRFDLVLMDIAMPGVSGIEAMRAIKALDAPPAVVMLTQHDNAEYRDRAMQAGADGFVVKSELFADLAPAMEEALKFDVEGEDVE